MQEKLSEVTLILIGSTAIILLLTGLVVFSLFINQKRKYRFRQEKSELKNKFDGELLRSHLEIQSQAFESISRELHDNVGTLISIAMVHIRSLTGGIPNHEQQKITEADSLLSEAMDTLRDISKSIHPENISRIGWQQSFITELDRVRKTKLFDVHYSDKGEPFNIELKKQVIIFRILQETLNNILKHSNGHHIDIHICFSNPEVTITIKDDGIGFQPQFTAQGSGIKNMLDRATMLPAVLNIKSIMGAGTEVTLSYEESFI
ncbi:Histidine kinase-, DNA gyrase B-, and HSP90-like ATPase [Chitinophaga sp. CF118]|uniref:sensor histidine kinase n=1 Tax=Chitinophaga sp. CF118 TaxID=1884367 RepID=UPI0008DF5044|nr:ATP-binding protein [Chitinophaga sp. CF118]SFE50745.1 Histidine kinase-, DNA gyrase B-, and HSP90-like ATPase [Chitinophaga sp. CF118]